LRIPKPLIAQVCAGYPSLTETRFRATGSLASYAYATAWGASFTAGKTFYATFGVGTSYDREQDARTYDFSLSGGADIADRTRRLYLCPLVTVALALGPYDYLLSQTDYRYVDAALGLGFAAVAIRSTRVAVIPSVGVRLARITVSQIPSDAQRQAGVPGWTQGDSYFLFTAGLGVILGRVVTVRPELTLTTGLVPVSEPNAFAAPFGRDENDVGIGISFGINFGRRNR
jgi:hypothetical protein